MAASSRETFFEELIAELEQGIVSDEFKAEFRVIDDSQPGIQEFQAMMSTMVDDILIKTGKTHMRRPHIIVLDDENPNAFMISRANPPILGFHRGVVDWFTSRDGPVGLNGHELYHSEAYETHGEHRNSKIEEGRGDINAIDAAYYTGHAPQAYIDMVKAFPDPKGTLGSLIKLMDPHPSRGTRITASETRLQHLKQEHTDVVTQETPFSPEDQLILQQVKEAKYESVILRQLRAQGFYEAEVPEKLPLIAAAVQALADYPLGRTAAVRDLALELCDIYVKQDVPEHREALDTLLDAILVCPPGLTQGEWEPRQRLFYAAAMHACGRSDHRKDISNDKYISNLSPIGKLAELSSLVSDLSFVNVYGEPGEDRFQAKLAEFTAKAERFNQVAATCPYDFESGIPHRLRPSHLFNPPYVEEVSLIAERIAEAPPEERAGLASELGKRAPWDNQLYLALRFPDPALTEMLHRLGAGVDPRMPPLDHDIQGFAVTRDYDFHPYYADYAYNPEGKIIGMSSPRYIEPAFKKANNNVLGSNRNPSELLSFAEYREKEISRLAAIDTEAKQLVLDTDWSLLEKDFWAFVTRHRRLLMPNTSIVEGGWGVAETFMERADALYVQDPEKYGPLLRDFLIGIDIDDIGTGNRIPGSLADMLYKDHRSISDWKDNTDTLFFSGLFTGHPYAEYVLSDTHGIFSRCEQLTMANHVVVPQNNVTQNYMVELQNRPYEMLDIPKPDSIDELTAAIEPLVVDPLIHISAANLSLPTSIARSRLLDDFMESHKAQDFTDNELYALEKLSLLCDAPSARNLIFEAHERRNQAVHSLSDTITRLAFVSNSELVQLRLFPDLRGIYEQHIMEMTDAISDPAVKLDTLRPLISGIQVPTGPLDEYGFGIAMLNPGADGQLLPDLGNPAFKSWVLDSYMGAQATVLGRDDGSERFAQAVQPVIDQIDAINNAPMRYALYSRLAESTRAQKSVCQDIQSRLKDISEKDISRADMQSRLLEYAMEDVSTNPKKQAALIKYLTGPLTESSVDEVNEHISFAKDAGQPNLAKMERNELVNLHRRYWDMPMEGRMLAMEYLVFPPEVMLEDAANGHQEFEKTKKNIIDQFVSDQGEYAEQARTILTAYVDVNEHKAQRLLLAAIVAASEPREGQAYRTGEVLARVLGALDPAGPKLVQGAHSLPIPQDIRDDMAHVKSMSKKPPRWEIHQWLEERGPRTRTPDEDIVHVGEVLGAGAYGVTVEVTKRNGDQAAITLLRPNVRTRAEIEFDRLLRAAEKLAAADPNMVPLRDLIQQASIASLQETDMNVAAQQARVASTLYDGMQITVDGQTFNFQTAGWLGHGKDYKETKIVTGAHFNDLPDNTPEALAHKQRIAKVLLTAEIYTIVRGMPFDHDRHGAQQRIEGNTISLFDFGALEIERPTPTQKRLMASTLIKALADNKKNDTPLPMALARQRDLLDVDEKDKQFLAAFERGLLALGDYTHYVGMGDIKQIFTALALNREIDGQLMRGAFDAAMEVRPSYRDIAKKVPGMVRDHLSGAHSGVPEPDRGISITKRPSPEFQADIQAREEAPAPDASSSRSSQAARTENDTPRDPSRFRRLAAAPSQIQRSPLRP